VPQQTGLAPDPEQDQSGFIHTPQPSTKNTTLTEEQLQQIQAREKLRQSQQLQFSKRSHTRIRPVDSLSESSKNVAEYSLTAVEFEKLQQLSGRTFDFDAFSDEEGKNSHCKNFASKTASFLDSDVSGKHVWMFPPPDQLLVKNAIDHVVDNWRKSPETTSACILLPKGLAHLTSGAQGRLRLIYTYAKGAKIWLSPSEDGTPIRPTKTTCVMNVYMLDPMSPQVLLHNIETKAAQTFQAKCHSHRPTTRNGSRTFSLQIHWILQTNRDEKAVSH
jgi:hypothetical protein